jgi:hypothetical protein
MYELGTRDRRAQLASTVENNSQVRDRIAAKDATFDNPTKYFAWYLGRSGLSAGFAL